MTLMLLLIGGWMLVSVGLGIIIGRCIAFGSRRAVLVAICLAGATTASAQERPRPDWTAYSVMVGGNVADLWTTHQAFQRGAHEGNGITSTNQIVPLALSKACATFAIGMTMRLLERHNHPRIAKVIGYLDGGVTFAAARHNHGVAR